MKKGFLISILVHIAIAGLFTINKKQEFEVQIKEPRISITISESQEQVVGQETIIEEVIKPEIKEEIKQKVKKGIINEKNIIEAIKPVIVENTKVSSSIIQNVYTIKKTMPDSQISKVNPFDNFIKQIQSKTRSIYPKRARQKGQEGLIILKITLTENGELESLEILKKTRYKQLNNSAIDLVKKVLPYQHNLGTSVTLEIPIRFELN